MELPEVQAKIPMPSRNKPHLTHSSTGSMKNEEALELSLVSLQPISRDLCQRAERVPFRHAVNQQRLLTVPTSNCQGEEIHRSRNYKQAVTQKIAKDGFKHMHESVAARQSTTPCCSVGHNDSCIFPLLQHFLVWLSGGQVHVHH